MTRREAVKLLKTELGLTDEQAKVMLDKVADDAEGNKTIALKQQSEYDSIAADKAKLETSLATAKSHQDWYERNASAIQKLQERHTKYAERYGDIDEANPNPNPNPNPGGGGTALTKEDIQKLVDAGVQAQLQALTPVWARSVVGTSKVTERHMRRNRKDEIDWEGIDKLAKENGGDVVAAYEARYKADTEAEAKAATDAEVKRRVDEEVAKVRSQANFPAAASDSTGSPGLSPHRADKADKFDRNSLLETARTGVWESAKPN